MIVAVGRQESKPRAAKCLSVFLALTETTSHQVASRSTGDELLMCLLLIILFHRLKEIRQFFIVMASVLLKCDIRVFEKKLQEISILI